MNPSTDSECILEASTRFPDRERFLKAIETIDRLNDGDPKRVNDEAVDVGYELYFSRLLFAKTLGLEENASEALLIAARSQHICRWEMPRADYPEGRAGYLKWRADLKGYHADKTATILSDLGYGNEMVELVRAINLKKDLKANSDAQTMEDALCLVFLESQFPEFRLKTDEAKMVTILHKTWAKMSERGRQAALNLDLGEEESRLVGLALGG